MEASDQNRLSGQDETNSLRLLKLSQKYLLEQEEEKAIRTFLESISSQNCLQESTLFPEEQHYYERGLEFYLNVNPEISPKETAQKLLLEFETLSIKHPEYHSLNLLLCTAYANLGRYDEFFQAFYKTYPHISDHYLAHKIIAILHVKLFEKGKTAEEREFYRKHAFESIMKAITIFPNDITLYKGAILLSWPQEKKEVINDCLSKIINSNIIIPRHEITFFVQEAIDSLQLDLAQKFVDKCREWYQYSRAINEIQEVISRKKNYE